MRRILVLGGVLAALVALLPALTAPAGAQGKEQVVFSGEANGSLGDVGFWIWCAVDQAGNYDDCNGAMAFDDLHFTRHVEGEVAEVGEGAYRMDVASTRDSRVACSLQNQPPVTSGHTNTVTISCSSPSGSASTNTAVVRATG
jgi:hypothetical protein